MISQKDCVAMILMFNRESEVVRKANAEYEANQNYITLNNLYLRIQNGSKKLTIHTGNQLRTLVSKAYPGGDPVMVDWWMGQFQRLPNWDNV